MSWLHLPSLKGVVADEPTGQLIPRRSTLEYAAARPYTEALAYRAFACAFTDSYEAVMSLHIKLSKAS